MKTGHYIDWFFGWLRAGRADWQHAHRRRLTARYLARRRKVKSLWIGAGVIMALNPDLSFICVLALVMALVSFAILDDT